MKKRKMVLLILACFLLVSLLCACGKKDDSKPQETPDIDVDEEKDDEPKPPKEDGSIVDGSMGNDHVDGSYDGSQDGSHVINQGCVHNIVIEPAIEPTCAADGWTEGAYCTKCGLRQEKFRIPALPHTWKTGSCFKPTVCTVCHAVDEERRGHNWEQGSCTICGMPTPSEGLNIMRDVRHGVCVVYGLGTCTDTDIVIPDTVQNCPVVSIRDDAFRSKKINSVYIPGSVTSIGIKAFSSCTEMTRVYIGEGVTEILDEAFAKCTSLGEIAVADGNETYYAKNNCLIKKENNQLILGCQNSVIPDGVTSIGASAFAYCTQLTSIVIPDSVTGIAEYSFYGCEALGQIVISNSVTSIGGYAFARCTALKSVILPDQLETVGQYWFSGCTALENVLIPDGVTKIGGHAFENCKQLRQIELPESLTSIGEYAFSNCDSLKSLTLPDGMISLGRLAISYCDALEETKLGNSLKTISQENFIYCPKLRSIVIPASVTDIGYDTFASSALLKDIYCEVTEKPKDWNIYKAMEQGLRIHWKDSWHYVDGVPTPK